MNYDVSEDRPAAQRRTLCIVLRRFSSRHGQSMLEMALLLPILLILIAGMIEIGVYANDYLTLLDATREGARFGVNLDPSLTIQEPFDARTGASVPFPDLRLPTLVTPGMTAEQLYDLCDQGKTVNFYYEVACLTFQNIPLGQLTTTTSISDDIVITVIGYTKTGEIVSRWPLAPSGVRPLPYPNPNDQSYHFKGVNDGPANPGCTISNTENCRCWSLYGVRGSSFDNARIVDALQSIRAKPGFSGAEAGGIVIVEVFRAHPHFTGLFTIGDYIPDPIQTHPYTIFPLPAAEPK